MIRAILFDLDGVLIDFTWEHYEALNRALGLFGFTITREQHLATFNGLPTQKKLELLDVPPKLKPFIAKMKQEYTKALIFQRIRPDYQKLILLRALSKHYKLACVSNAVYESIDRMLTMAGVRDWFEVIVSAQGVQPPKPAPTMYWAAMTMLVVKPDECVIVEDAPPGLAAAYASGARVIPVVGSKDVHTGLFQKEGLL